MLTLDQAAPAVPRSGAGCRQRGLSGWRLPPWKRKVESGFDKGYFVVPTIFIGVSPDMAIFREKIFGPVLSVMTFNTVEEVVQLANDTHYGLGTGIWSKGIDKALLVPKRLRSGTVCVYTFLETAVQLPFGGLGQSGLGRENGLEGLLEFMDVKSTFITLGKCSDALPLALDRAR